MDTPIILEFSNEKSLIAEVITQYDILSSVSDEEIMSYYLNKPITKGLFTSPFRDDKNPTCSLYRSKNGILYFKDFGNGDHLNCFQVVMKTFNCNFQTALNKIATDFGILQGNLNLSPIKKQIITEKNPAKIQVEIRDFLIYELAWWERFGITKKILNYYNVYSCNTVFLNDKINFINNNQFAFGYYGGIKNNLELWRIYYPKNKSFRFLSNWDKNMIQGHDQLKYNTDFLVITKSMKDVMCLRSLGIEAIAPCSENYFIPDDMYKKLASKYKYILLLYDNDYAGIVSANKIRKQYKKVFPIIIPRNYGVKDVSDFYKKYGRRKTFRAIYHLKKWLKKQLK